MKRNSTLLISAILIALILTTACQQQQATDTRQSRIAAFQTRQLEEQITALETQLAEVKALNAEYKQEIARLEEMVETRIQKNVTEILSVVLEQNQQLRAELEELRQ